jgi:hypothetical protein
MRRSTKAVATALSLLLCVVTNAVWVTSYWRTQYVGLGRPDHWLGALSMAGVLRLERGGFPMAREGWSYESYLTPAGGLWRELYARDTRGVLQFAGMGYSSIDYSSNGSMKRTAIYLPHWLLALAFALLPAWYAWTTFVRRKPAPGHCDRCGYDLRASTERCPECGMIISPGSRSLVHP